MEPESIINTVKDRIEAEALDAFEICFVGNAKLSVEARNGEAESFSRGEQRGIAVRVLKNKRIGWASSTDMSPSALGYLLKSVMANVKEISQSEEAVIPKPRRVRKGASQLPHQIDEKPGKPLSDIPDSEKIALAIELERATKQQDERITKVRQPLYEEITRHVSIVNSNDLKQTAKRQMTLCAVRAIAQENGDSESGYDFSFSPRFEDLDAEGTAKKAALRAVALLGAKPVSTGKYNIVFEPRAAASLVRLLVTSFYADNVQRKKSAVADKRGKLVYSKLVNIIDDGLLPDGFGSFLFDDEGVPKRKITLVENGIILNWLYDSQRAARDKRISTGSSRRQSIHKPPQIGVSNCFLDRGDVSFHGVLKMANNGVLITDLIGLHTANPITGFFSLGAEGFHIHNGEKGSPVRGILISGNVHDLFSKLAATGSDFQFFTHYGSPSFLVPDMQVSGAS